MKQELKLLLDENIGLKVYREPQRQGHYVSKVFICGFDNLSN